MIRRASPSEVGQHVAVGEPEHAPALPLQVGVALRVMVRTRAGRRRPRRPAARRRRRNRRRRAGSGSWRRKWAPSSWRSRRIAHRRFSASVGSRRSWRVLSRRLWSMRGTAEPPPRPSPLARARAGISEQEVALRHGQHGRGLAGEQLAVGADLVGLGVDLDHRAWPRCGSSTPCRCRRGCCAPRRARAAGRSGGGCASSTAAAETKWTALATAERPIAAEHRAVVDRLRGRDRGVGVAHGGGGDGAALDHHVGLDAEEGGRPEDEVGELADLDRAHDVADALRDRRVDRVLGDVALGRGNCRCRRSPRAGGRAAGFILWAVCQVRMITSPTRPMAWLSEDIIEMAPRSCRMSSAAIVSFRIRLSAKATSSGIDGSR